MKVTVDSKIRLIDSPLGNLSAEYIHQLIKRSISKTYTGNVHTQCVTSDDQDVLWHTSRHTTAMYKMATGSGLWCVIHDLESSVHLKSAWRHEEKLLAMMSRVSQQLFQMDRVQWRRCWYCRKTMIQRVTIQVKSIQFVLLISRCKSIHPNTECRKEMSYTRAGEAIKP